MCSFWHKQTYNHLIFIPGVHLHSPKNFIWGPVVPDLWLEGGVLSVHPPPFEHPWQRQYAMLCRWMTHLAAKPRFAFFCNYVHNLYYNNRTVWLSVCVTSKKRNTQSRATIMRSVMWLVFINIRNGKTHWASGIATPLPHVSIQPWITTASRTMSGTAQ